MTDSTIAEYKSVSFSCPGAAPLFEKLSCQFKRGAFYLIRGRSGTGKSTVLRLINRLEEPSEGEIRFQGKPLSTYAPPALRKAILYVQQMPTVLDASVRENLLLPFAFRINRDLIRPGGDELRAFLEKFDLDPVCLDQHAMKLSVGQRQRVCLIRGLILSPHMMLLDEPTSALDEESSQFVQSSVERLCLESGITVVMVSHRTFQPQNIVPVVLEMTGGRLREVAWSP